jgi:hypothetical protein
MTLQRGIPMSAGTKPKLTILLGAGSTMQLYSKDRPGGMPSTIAVTERLDRLEYPRAPGEAVAIIGPNAASHLRVPRHIPIVPFIFRALRGAFANVDFEMALHAFEQLAPFVATAESLPTADQYRLPVISAFAELRRAYDILDNPLLLALARGAMIAEVHKAFSERSLPQQPLPLNNFVNALATEFQVAVFTLNYDDVVDRSRDDWLDGFSGRKEVSSQGAYWEAHGFNPKEFRCWRDATRPLLVHLHGSIRFGYLRKDVWPYKYLAKYSDPAEALRSIMPSLEDGRIVSTAPAPIISGLDKVAKLAHEPEPFGHYYQAFIDSLLGCDRLLVIGYGGRDAHVNAWIEEWQQMHGDGRRAVWISLLTIDEHRGAPSEVMELVWKLADGHCDSLVGSCDACDHSYDLGRLRLISSGFPVNNDTCAAAIKFLLG